MRVDDQRRLFRIVRKIEPAGHLAVWTRQRQIPLAVERDRAFAEKCPDSVNGRADLTQWRLRAVRCDEAAALQQFTRGDEFGVDPGCRVVHHVSPYSAARAGSAAAVDVAAGKRGKTSLASSLMPFSASW